MIHHNYSLCQQFKFHMQKSLDVIYYITRIKEQMYVILSLDAEIAFNKIQIVFMVKSIIKLGICTSVKEYLGYNLLLTKCWLVTTWTSSSRIRNKEILERKTAALGSAAQVCLLLFALGSTLSHSGHSVKLKASWY